MRRRRWWDKEKGRGGQQGLTQVGRTASDTGLAVSLSLSPQAMSTGWTLAGVLGKRGEPSADVSAPCPAQPNEGSRTPALGSITQPAARVPVPLLERT